MNRILFAALALACVCSPALADVATTTLTTQDSTVVAVPLGTYATTVLEIVRGVILPAALVVVAWISAKLPGALGGIVKTVLTEQFLSKAIDFGINTVEGAVKGKTWNVNVGNAVLANAMRFVEAHAPAWLDKWLGGSDGIKDRIIARLPIDQGNLSASTGTVPTTLTGAAAS